jgi:hypothetical protein
MIRNNFLLIRSISTDYYVIKSSFIIGLLFLCLNMPYTLAQVSYGGYPLSNLKNLPVPEKLELGYLDVKPYLEQDYLNDEAGKPPRIGISREVSVDLTDHHHIWTETSPTTKVWRFGLRSEGAINVNVTFYDFYLAPGSALFVYDSNKEVILGQFNEKSNNASGIFSVSNLPGDELIIELIEESDVSLNDGWFPASHFRIAQLGHFYRFDAFASDLKSSEECQVNINCPEGDEWQRQKRGVARIILKDGEDYGYCTGSLINNTASDGRVMFITANHCGETSAPEDYAQWQFRFNYERSTCASVFAPPNHTLTGSSLLSEGLIEGGSDFKLLELTQTPPINFKPYFNGWDRTEVPSAHGVSIHHPAGDVKKISTYTDSLGTGTFPGSMTGAFWRVAWVQTQTNWGVTEGGSSGSPLFGEEKKIIGILTGGNSSCTNQIQGRDLYGKFHIHWDENDTLPEKQLAPFLDPLALDPQSMDGFDPHFRWLTIVTAHQYDAFSFTSNPTTIRPGIYEFEKGEEATVTAISSIPNTAWVFDKWVLGEFETTNDSVTIVMNSDSTIQAIYKLSDDAVALLFDIKNVQEEFIDDAIITLNGITWPAGENQILALLPDIMYTFSISSPGYDTYEAEFTLTPGIPEQSISVTMARSKLLVSFIIKDFATSEVIPDAAIRIAGNTYEKGVYTFELVPETYIYTVIHEEYTTRYGQFTILQTSQTITVELKALDTSVEIVDDTDPITMRPNPAYEDIHIDAGENILQVNIYNLSGILINSNEIQKQSATLSVSALRSGLYLVEIITPNGRFLRKLQIIKQ